MLPPPHERHARDKGTHAEKMPGMKQEHRQRQNAQVATVVEQLRQKGDTLKLEVEENKVAFSHLNKELWPASKGKPAITKRDYAIYLAQVSPAMLGHIKNRPLTMIRFPDGINKIRFLQKHLDYKLPDFVNTITYYSEEKETDREYILCNNLSTLMWLAQLSVLEMHMVHFRTNQEPDAWNLPTDATGSDAAIESSLLNYPDCLVFDLDPYIYSGREKEREEPQLNKLGFRKTCEVAFWLKGILNQIGIKPFVKTSGKTGLHIYVPIIRNMDFAEVRSVAEAVGHFLMDRHPAEITMKWSVKQRTGKIFFDHNMNARGKTLPAPYSTRNTPEASVSMPLDWAELELETIYPGDFTLHNAVQRLEISGDNWASFANPAFDIRSLLRTWNQKKAV